MRRRAEADHRTSAVEVVGDVLHLLVREILEAEKDDHRSAVAQRVEPGDVRAARLDEAGFRVGGEEDTALEAVVPRKDSGQRRKRFLRSVFVVAGQPDDVLADAGPLPPS